METISSIPRGISCQVLFCKGRKVFGKQVSIQYRQFPIYVGALETPLWVKTLKKCNHLMVFYLLGLDCLSLPSSPHPTSQKNTKNTLLPA